MHTNWRYAYYVMFWLGKLQFDFGLLLFVPSVNVGSGSSGSRNTTPIELVYRSSDSDNNSGLGMINHSLTLNSSTGQYKSYLYGIEHSILSQLKGNISRVVMIPAVKPLNRTKVSQVFNRIRRVPRFGAILSSDNGWHRTSLQYTIREFYQNLENTWVFVRPDTY